MEPRAAVAQWKGGKLTVWTGSQRPFLVRDQLTEVFHLSKNRVRVIVPDTGSGYGGKHTGECAIEAARLAKATGRPVKLMWTREEEFTWGYFRPAGLIEVTSGVNNDGTLTAWALHNYNSGHSGIEDRYEIPNRHVEFHPARSPLRQGSYRALAATANHFARESHMDELATQELGMDPLDFRLRNLKDEQTDRCSRNRRDAIRVEKKKALQGSRPRSRGRVRQRLLRCHVPRRFRLGGHADRFSSNASLQRSSAEPS